MGETSWNSRSGVLAMGHLTDPASPGAFSLNGFEYVGADADEDDEELDFEIHDASMAGS